MSWYYYHNYGNYDKDKGTSMARPIVTQELVFETADRLSSAGEEASIIAVQERIGGGSYSTVKRFLDAWKEARKTAAPPIDVPPDIAAQGQAFVRGLWAAAHTLAEQRIAEIRAETGEQVRQARAALEAAEATITRLETEAETLAQQRDDAQHEREEARAGQEEARASARVAEARAAEQGQQITDLRRQIETQAAELATARPLAAEHARFSGELAALRQQLTDQAALIERLSNRS
jgi:flagellar biosynthesis GTPase FlhF